MRGPPAPPLPPLGHGRAPGRAVLCRGWPAPAVPLLAAVHRFEGTVNQFTGDGVMALFGAPIAHEDHAVRAVAAALEVQARLRQYAERLRQERGIEFAVRIGINTGPVVVGKIGDDLRLHYTAQGETVNLL